MFYFQSRQSNGSSASGWTVKTQVSEPLPQVNSTPASVPTPAVSETATILSTDVSPSFAPTTAVLETASILSTNVSPSFVPTAAVSETASILSTDVLPSFVPTAAVCETASILSTKVLPPSSSFAHSPPPGIAPHCADVPPRVRRPYCEDDNDILVRSPCVWYLYSYGTMLPVKIINTLMQIVRDTSFSGVSGFLDKVFFNIRDLLRMHWKIRRADFTYAYLSYI
jgi:hypothetical protein